MGIKKLKTYIVSWYGPFHSIEEMDEWQHLQNIDFCLYLLQGKKPNAKIYSYYCGQTKKRTVPERFNDRNHHIREIPNRRSIWVGTFENRYNKQDIDIAENMFIDLLWGQFGEQCLNKRSLYFQECDFDVLFICKWHNPKLYRQPECSLKLVLPEVIVYFSGTDEIKIAKKLRPL